MYLQASNFIFHVFFEILQRYCSLVIWVLWTCLALDTVTEAIILWKNFLFICRQKINFIPHVFLEILQRYANLLFWVLWPCLAMLIQNDSINTRFMAQGSIAVALVWRKYLSQNIIVFFLKTSNITSFGIFVLICHLLL